MRNATIWVVISLITLFVLDAGGQGWGTSETPLHSDEISRYAVDAIQLITSCFSSKNIRHPIRFGRCILNRFVNSHLKEAVLYPKLKQVIRKVVNRTVASENSLKFKIIDKFLNRQFSSRPRYGYGGSYGGGGGGYNDYGNTGNTWGNDGYDERTTGYENAYR